MARTPKPEVTENAPIIVPRKSLFERVAGYLDATDWKYSAETDKQYFSMGCRLKNATARVILDVTESEGWGRVLVFVTYPVFVPEARRMQALESINRINYGMIFGNLEMDMADGEIRARTAIESDGGFSDAMIERALHSALTTADENMTALIAIAFGLSEPVTAADTIPEPASTTLQ